MPLNPLRRVRHVNQSRCDDSVIYANTAEIEFCDSFLKSKKQRVVLFFSRLSNDHKKQFVCCSSMNACTSGLEMASRRFGERHERSVENEIEKCDQSFAAAVEIAKPLKLNESISAASNSATIFARLFSILHHSIPSLFRRNLNDSPFCFNRPSQTRY